MRNRPFSSYDVSFDANVKYLLWKVFETLKRYHQCRFHGRQWLVPV